MNNPFHEKSEMYHIRRNTQYVTQGLDYVIRLQKPYDTNTKHKG